MLSPQSGEMSASAVARSTSWPTGVARAASGARRPLLLLLPVRPRPPVKEEEAGPNRASMAARGMGGSESNVASGRAFEAGPCCFVPVFWMLGSSVVGYHGHSSSATVRLIK